MRSDRYTINGKGYKNLPLDKIGVLTEGGDTSSWYKEESKTDTGLGCS
jgi:hypothetical protein